MYRTAIGRPAGSNGCVIRSIITTSDDTPMTKIFHPLLALIASATDKELAKYVEYLKHENKILRARLPKQVHTTTEERTTLLKFGKVIGKAIEELVSIVSPATFLPLGSRREERQAETEEPQRWSAEAEGASRTGPDDCQQNRLWIDPHHWRIAQAGNHEYQSSDGEEHPERTWHRTQTGSNVRLLG